MSVQWRSALQPVLDRNRALVEAHPDMEPDNFIQAYMLEMCKRTVDSSFSEWQLYASVIDLWGAGMETTSTAMQWALLLMATHPDEQRRVQEEIDTVVGSAPVTMAARPRMPYLIATLTEVLRHSESTGLNLSRMARQDMQIGRHTVLKGTTVVGQTSAVHTSDKHFNNWQEFNPQRYIDNPALSEKVMPFSLGKRQCMGESLARMELFLIFCALLRRYHISLDCPVDLHGTRGTTNRPPAHRVIFARR